MIWVTCRLKKPGVSGKIRREIRARYVEYMLIYTLFSWPICFVTKPSYRYIPSLNSFIGGTKMVYSTESGYTLVLLSGLIMAVSRLRDRITLQMLKNFGLWITCRLPDKISVDQAMKAANLNTFLTTSLNTEVVVTILKGITILAAASSDSMDNMKESDMLKIKQSANIQIQQIKILNPKYWEIGVQSTDLDKEDEEQTGDDEMIQLSTDEAPQRSSALRINPSFFSAIPESYFQSDENSRKSMASTHTTSTSA